MTFKKLYNLHNQSCPSIKFQRLILLFIILLLFTEMGMLFKNDVIHNISKKNVIIQKPIEKKESRIKLEKSEFPNTLWIGDPKFFKIGRKYSIIWNVIHCNEGSEDEGSAYNAAIYDKKRNDSVSTHFYYDPTETIQEVKTMDTSLGSLLVGNNRGIQHELCGRSNQTKNEWLDEKSKLIIDRAANTCAYTCIQYGIQAKWLNDKEIIKRNSGFVLHSDISRVIEGEYVDPGQNFPKEYFMEKVKFWIEKIK